MASRAGTNTVDRGTATGAKSARKISQRGQGMTEYIIIVALIAVGAIVVYQLFGQVVRSQTAAIAHEVAGADGAPSRTVANDAATLTDAQRTKKGLDNFTGGATTAGAGGQ